MDKADIFTNIGFILAGIFGGFIAYYGKKPQLPAPSADPVVTGVGLEFGNRLQTDQVIAELKRVADALTILADRKQATTEAKLDRILQELDEAEEREREAREREPRPSSTLGRSRARSRPPK